jgi:hypothetical protein
MFELILAAYCAACGFVAAGLTASFIQLVTNQPVKFAVSLETTLVGIRDVLIVTWCGPFIIMRNAVRARLIERRPIGWLVASAIIAATWSTCSGIIVLQIALTAL